MGHPGSNKVREFDCQDIQATIVRRATEKNFKSILFTLLNNKETKAIAFVVLKTSSALIIEVVNHFKDCTPKSESN